MRTCPKCESEDIHRSHTRSTWESWRKKITGKRPYRCHACGWRGWGLDFGARFGDHDAQSLTERTVLDVPYVSEPPEHSDARLSNADLSRLDGLEQGTGSDK